MDNAVSPGGRRGVPWGGQAAGLYATDGARKYLNAAERRRALAATKKLPPDKALFAMTLAWTGARISEVLALTPASFQIERGVVAIVTLKRRRFFVREVPVPPKLMAALDRHFEITSRQHGPEAARDRLWPCSRTTAWRVIKRVMETACVRGRQACPRGLRHAFGIGTLQAGVPLNLTKQWLGHASMSTTAIYAAACGPEEIAFAERFWRTDRPQGRCGLCRRGAGCRARVEER
jgi:integrase/recombinase XerD